MAEKTLITPNHPFTNRIIFIKMLNSCDEYVYWLDFSQKGLELLAEALDGKALSEVRIIMASEHADPKFRGLFKNLRDELAAKGTKCECKVLMDSKAKASVHDCFIISRHNAYNIPSPDIIARVQLSEITKSDNRKGLLGEFDTLWKDSKDIVHDWNEIEKAVGGKG